MSNLIDNYPAMVYDEVTNVGRVRKDLQDGVFDRPETPIQDMMDAHEIENNENIEYVRQQENTEPRNSANLESLYYFIQDVDSDMKFVMRPPFTGKIKNDNMVRAKLEKYYKVSIKKHARFLKIYFDGLIKYDGFDSRRFDDYQRLEELVRHTDDEIADEYLLKLLTIAKQLIPANYYTVNRYVVDSNSIDPNKMNEG